MGITMYWEMDCIHKLVKNNLLKLLVLWISGLKLIVLHKGQVWMTNLC